MVPLALVLLLLVTIVVIAAVIAGDGPATLNLVGADIITSERTLFLAGVVTTAVAGLALWMLVKGLQRAKRRRSEIHQLRDATARAAQREDQGPAPTAPSSGPTSGPSSAPTRGPASGPQGTQDPHRSPGPQASSQGGLPGGTTHGTSRHASTGPGRGVRSPTDPGEYQGPVWRPDDDERDHFESLPRE